MKLGVSRQQTPESHRITSRAIRIRALRGQHVDGQKLPPLACTEGVCLGHRRLLRRCRPPENRRAMLGERVGIGSCRKNSGAHRAGGEHPSCSDRRKKLVHNFPPVPSPVPVFRGYHIQKPSPKPELSLYRRGSRADQPLAAWLLSHPARDRLEPAASTRQSSYDRRGRSPRPVAHDRTAPH